MRDTAVHEDFSRTVEHSVSSPRGFGLTITVALLVLGLLPLIAGRPVRWWAVIAGAVIGIVSLFRPSLLGGLSRIWLRLGMLLARITNPVIMGLLFYLLFTPMGWLLRLTGKDPLRLKKQNSGSYWIERRPAGPPPNSMANQF